MHLKGRRDDGSARCASVFNLPIELPRRLVPTAVAGGHWRDNCESKSVKEGGKCAQMPANSTPRHRTPQHAAVSRASVGGLCCVIGTELRRLSQPLLQPTLRAH